MREYDPDFKLWKIVITCCGIYLWEAKWNPLDFKSELGQATNLYNSIEERGLERLTVTHCKLVYQNQ